MSINLKSGKLINIHPHIAGGISFSGIALNDTGGAQVRFFVGLSAMQKIQVTSKLVYQTLWLPLTRELLSVSETEGEKCRFSYILCSFSPSVFCSAKSTSLVRGRHDTNLYFLLFIG